MCDAECCGSGACNRFLGGCGVGGNIAVDTVALDKMCFDSASVTINNLQIQNVETFNNVSSSSNDGLFTEYVIAGKSARTGLLEYTTDPVADEANNMIDNYDAKGITGFRSQFGVIDFVEDDANAGNGQFHASNTLVVPQVVCVSDERLKEQVRPIRGAVDKVSKLRGYTYRLKDGQDGSAGAASGGKGGGEDGRTMGLMAQEVREVAPEAVVASGIRLPDGGPAAMAVNYNAIVPLLVESVRELKQECDDLKHKLACREEKKKQVNNDKNNTMK